MSENQFTFDKVLSDVAKPEARIPKTEIKPNNRKSIIEE
jgi:hypothetical protein